MYTYFCYLLVLLCVVNRCVGLGPKSSNCLMISGNDNQGDGFTKCDEGKDYKAPDGYAVGCQQTGHIALLLQQRLGSFVLRINRASCVSYALPQAQCADAACV